MSQAAYHHAFIDMPLLTADIQGTFRHITNYNNSADIPSVPHVRPLIKLVCAEVQQTRRCAGVQVAKDDEVMVAISNSNYAMPGGMLDTWISGVKRANVTNAMLIALDKETKEHAESMGIPAHFMTLQVKAPGVIA